jgi:hypothetical protein
VKINVYYDSLSIIPKEITEVEERIKNWNLKHPQYQVFTTFETIDLNLPGHHSIYVENHQLFQSKIIENHQFYNIQILTLDLITETLDFIQESTQKQTK